MSLGSNGLTVLLQGVPRPFGLVGNVVFDGATEQEASSLLDACLPETLIIDPEVPWHRALAEKAHTSGAAVVAVGSPPPPRCPIDEWVRPCSDRAEVTSRLELAITRAHERRRQASEANTDALTGLLNRRGLWASARQLAARARRTGADLALVLIDLDDFKGVNDRYGHPAGDRLLRRVGDVLHRAAREDEVRARLGGDEFALVLTGGEAQARLARDRLLAALGAAGIAASAGLAVVSPDARLTALYDQADAALRQAKLRNRRPSGTLGWLFHSTKEALSDDRLHA